MSEEKSSANRMLGQLIILNGASSAGKSSIAKNLQTKLNGNFQHVKMDAFLNGLPPIGDFRRQDVIDDRLCIIEDTVAKLLKSGHNVILDIVFWQRTAVSYEKYHPYLIAIKPSLEVLEAREKARNDRYIGTAKSQFSTLHQDISYNLEIDNSSLTAEQAADKIIEAYARAKSAPTLPELVERALNPERHPA